MTAAATCKAEIASSAHNKMFMIQLKTIRFIPVDRKKMKTQKVEEVVSCFAVENKDVKNVIVYPLIFCSRAI